MYCEGDVYYGILSGIACTVRVMCTMGYSGVTVRVMLWCFSAAVWGIIWLVSNWRMSEE